VNPGAELPEGIPPQVSTALARLYVEDLQTLAARFHGCVDGWLQSALSLLEETRTTTLSQRVPANHDPRVE